MDTSSCIQVDSSVCVDCAGLGSGMGFENLESWVEIQFCPRPSGGGYGRTDGRCIQSSEEGKDFSPPPFLE